MTNEEAIEHIRYLSVFANNKNDREAVNKSIEALKEKSCDGCHYLNYFNETCNYCMRGKLDRFISEEDFLKGEET